MKVVFRADASVKIGSGHVMRCLTLAGELSRLGHECLFICREHKGHLRELIESRGFKVSMLSNASGHRGVSPSSENTPHADWLGASWQQDAKQTVAVVEPIKPDWLIVDHYALDAHWEQQIAATVGRVMVIDDLADRNHECALLLDQNLGRNLSDYDGLVPASCRRLVGPRFALLRPEFAAIRERSLERRAEPKLKRILISLGGVDQTNVTGKVLQLLAESELARETELDIIMGAAAPSLDEVEQQVTKLPFDATLSVNVSDMAQRMCLADLSIGAVGSTSWERCCLGLPAILVVLANNQKSAANALRESGAAIVADDSADVADELGRLASHDYCAQVLKRMTEAGADMIDGFGCARVVNELVGKGWSI